MASPFFPSKTLRKMSSAGLSESDALDAFYHGESKTLPSGMKVMIKKYNGYEIGVGYTHHPTTGEYVIISTWKRARR
ncbi:hypothetical protein HY404_01470 [Candidatus Microgenomates bacterium]|nr:hypothetical protein [Candidatus Microgenomates bacterium]